MLSPGAKTGASELVLRHRTNSVAPVIDEGVAALLLTALPVTVAAELKNSLPASIADAATSDVFGRACRSRCSARREVCAGRGWGRPMAKLPSAAAGSRLRPSGDRLGRAVRQVELKAHRVAIVRIGGAETDRNSSCDPEVR